MIGRCSRDLLKVVVSIIINPLEIIIFIFPLLLFFTSVDNLHLPHCNLDICGRLLQLILPSMPPLLLELVSGCFVHLQHVFVEVDMVAEEYGRAEELPALYLFLVEAAPALCKAQQERAHLAFAPEEKQDYAEAEDAGEAGLFHEEGRGWLHDSGNVGRVYLDNLRLVCLLDHGCKLTIDTII